MNLWVSWRVTPPATSGRMLGPVDIPLSCLERTEFTALTQQEGASRMAWPLLLIHPGMATTTEPQA
jgi:hypothetical protein